MKKTTLLMTILLLISIVSIAVAAYSIVDTTEQRTLEEDNVVALIVDYENENSIRMQEYLGKAGFKVIRAEKQNEYDVKDFDALVIPGGHNITPSVYGADCDPHTYGTNIKIDNLQIDAVKRFAKAGKPILGVCRGCQVVNVAFGGTIEQHIPGWHKKNREISIKEGSWTYSTIGADENVWHFHHQCVDKLGKGLVATSWDAEDNRIEAFEHETLPIYGLQWHPDAMGDRGVDIFKSFRALVIKCKKK